MIPAKYRGIEIEGQGIKDIEKSFVRVHPGERAREVLHQAVDVLDHEKCGRSVEYPDRRPDLAFVERCPFDAPLPGP